MQRSFKLFKQSFFQTVYDCQPVTNFSEPITKIVCSYCALGTAYVQQLQWNHDELKINYNEEVEAADLKELEKVDNYLKHEQTESHGFPINWEITANHFVKNGYIHAFARVLDAKKTDPFLVRTLEGNSLNRMHYLFEALHCYKFHICYMLLVDYPFQDGSFREYAGTLCGWYEPTNWLSRKSILGECAIQDNIPMATFLLEQKASPDLPEEKMPLFVATWYQRKSLTTLFYQHSEKKFSSPGFKNHIEYNLLPEDEKQLAQVKNEIAKEFNNKMLGSNPVSSFLQWFGSDYNQAKLIARGVQEAPNIQTIKNIMDSQIAFLEGRRGQAFRVPEWKVSFPEVDPSAKKRDLTNCTLYKLLNSIKENLLSITPNPHAAASAGPGP